MLGSEFVRSYAAAGLPAWEAAALALARQDSLVPWPWIDLQLRSAAGDQATIQIRSDVLAVGTADDFVRLPLTPGAAQSILNLSGALLPTAWIEYQAWRAAPIKLAPTAMVPNLGASLTQYAQHSALIDSQIGSRLPTPGALPAGADLSGAALVAGQKKAIVVGNFYQPHKVLIFGWYRPPPAPDVFDDGSPMASPHRQPIQPRSNVHGDFYVDYSHGVRAIHPECTVNGRPMATADLYQHPQLSALVSNEGPVRVLRYPSSVTPPPSPTLPTLVAENTVLVAPTEPFGAGVDLGRPR